MLNRRMPNGTYGGVRGERKSPLLDFTVWEIIYLGNIRINNKDVDSNIGLQNMIFVTEYGGSEKTLSSAG